MPMAEPRGRSPAGNVRLWPSVSIREADGVPGALVPHPQSDSPCPGLWSSISGVTNPPSRRCSPIPGMMHSPRGDAPSLLGQWSPRPPPGPTVPAHHRTDPHPHAVTSTKSSFAPKWLGEDRGNMAPTHPPTTNQHSKSPFLLPSPGKHSPSSIADSPNACKHGTGCGTQPAVGRLSLSRGVG